MLKCREIEVLLSAYIDGEVTEQEKLTVEEHLNVCPVCQAMVAEFSQLHRLYQDMEVREAPADFRQQLTERIESRRRFAFPQVLPRFVYVFSCALLVTIGGIVAALYLTDVLPFRNTAEEFDVYAEDILFGQTVSLTDDIFSSGDELFSFGDVNVAEEILNTIEFNESDSSFFFDVEEPQVRLKT